MIMKKQSNIHGPGGAGVGDGGLGAGGLGATPFLTVNECRVYQNNHATQQDLKSHKVYLSTVRNERVG